MNKIKSLLITIILFTLSPSANSQMVVGDTLPNFILSDIHGNTHDLYKYMNSNKYLCIDFFGIDCDKCKSLVNIFNDIYNNYGCNTNDIIFLSINNKNTNAQVSNFKQEYGGVYPAISGIEGNGKEIYDSLGIDCLPHLILINPKKIIVEDLWPINKESIDSILKLHNIKPHICNEVNINSNINKQNLISPNPATDNIYVNTTIPANYNIYNLSGKILLTGKIHNNNINIYTLKKGTYILKIYNKTTFVKSSIFIRN